MSLSAISHFSNSLRVCRHVTNKISIINPLQCQSQRAVGIMPRCVYNVNMVNANDKHHDMHDDHGHWQHLQGFRRSLCMTTWTRSSIRTWSSPPVHVGLHGPCKSGSVCCCSALHTTGDKEMSEFLQEEIELEKKNEKPPPSLKGFDVKTDGSEVTLTKNLENEIITLKFNVNHSVEDEASMEFDQSQQKKEHEPSMLSKPAFIVEVNKGGPLTLTMQCVFPLNEEAPPEMEGATQEDIVDVIEIQDVALIKKGQEWGDSVYSISGSVMDGNLYDMMLTFLEERGIDGEFIEQLIQFSTSYEHKQYISFLKDMQSFSLEK